MASLSRRQSQRPEGGSAPPAKNPQQIGLYLGLIGGFPTWQIAGRNYTDSVSVMGGGYPVEGNEYALFAAQPDRMSHWVAYCPPTPLVQPSGPNPPTPTVGTSNWICEGADFARTWSWTAETLNLAALAPRNPLTVAAPFIVVDKPGDPGPGGAASVAGWTTLSTQLSSGFFTSASYDDFIDDIPYMGVEPVSLARHDGWMYVMLRLYNESYDEESGSTFTITNVLLKLNANRYESPLLTLSWRRIFPGDVLISDVVIIPREDVSSMNALLVVATMDTEETYQPTLIMFDSGTGENIHEAASPIDWTGGGSYWQNVSYRRSSLIYKDQHLILCGPSKVACFKVNESSIVSAWDSETLQFHTHGTPNYCGEAFVMGIVGNSLLIVYGDEAIYETVEDIFCSDGRFNFGAEYRVPRERLAAGLSSLGGVIALEERLG